MKHSLKDILGIFAKGAEHTHERAVQDTYEAGFNAGVAHKSAEFEAGLGSPAPAKEAAKTEGSSDEKASEGAASTETAKDAEAAKTTDPQA